MPFSDLHLPDPLGAALAALGWRHDSPLVQGVVPTAARGHNLVAITPPSPAWAGPALAGMLARAGEGGITLVVGPPESIGEWTVLLDAFGAGDQAVVAPGPGTASRRLHNPPLPRVLVAPPATALELQRRSRLPADQVSSVLIAWPELWDDAGLLPALLHDVSREAQRVILSSSLDSGNEVAERHAWRAMTIGAAEADLPATGPVQTVQVGWGRRVAVLPELVEVLDPESVAVWTLDTSRHAEISRALTGLAIPWRVTHAAPTPASAIIAFDLPMPGQLAFLLEAGDVVLLEPSGSEGWVRRVAEPRRLLRLPGQLDASTGEAARRRTQITRALHEAPLDAAMHVLSPMFERHEPSAVAAAVYHLWTSEQRPHVVPRETAPQGVVRVWVGIGRRDQAGPNDLVGVLANELRVERSHIGRIDVRETYSLVEVPAEEAERIASGLTGKTVRKRRLVARVDRKR